MNPQTNLTDAELMNVMTGFSTAFGELHTLDALAVLGEVTTQAFKRRPKADRMQDLRNWTELLTAAVRDSLD
jgi:hypothetical protein